MFGIYLTTSLVFSLVTVLSMGKSSILVFVVVFTAITALLVGVLRRKWMIKRVRDSYYDDGMEKMHKINEI